MTIFDKFLRPLQLLISIAILCFMCAAYAQSVVSLSAEVLKDIAADELYWQVGVTCSGVDEPRLMQQRAGEVAWCAVAIPQLCSENKDAIAEQLCSEEFELLVVSDSPQNQPVEAVKPAPVTAVPSAPAPVAQEEIVAPRPTVAPAQQPLAIIQSEPIIDTPTNTPSGLFDESGLLMSSEEISIEEELIRIEEEMLTLRLQEIELEQQVTQNSEE